MILSLNNFLFLNCAHGPKTKYQEKRIVLPASQQLKIYSKAAQLEGAFFRSEAAIGKLVAIKLIFLKWRSSRAACAASGNDELG